MLGEERDHNVVARSRTQPGQSVCNRVERVDAHFTDTRDSFEIGFEIGCGGRVRAAWNNSDGRTLAFFVNKGDLGALIIVCRNFTRDDLLSVLLLWRFFSRVVEGLGTREIEQENERVSE